MLHTVRDATKIKLTHYRTSRVDRVGNTRESFLGGPRVTVVTRLAQTAAVRRVIRVHSSGDEFFRLSG
jgi:hypothetical protein